MTNAYAKYSENSQLATGATVREIYVNAIEEGVGLSIALPYKGWVIDIALQHQQLGGATDVKVYNPSGLEVDLGNSMQGLTKATADIIRLILCQIDCVISHA